MGDQEPTILGNQGAGEGEGQAEPPAWTEQLPKEMRTHEAVMAAENAPAFVQSHIDLLQQIKDSEPPGDGATGEALATYQKSLGWDLENLTVADPEGLEEDQALPAESKLELAQAAAGLGMKPDQAAGMLKLFYDFRAQEAAQQAEQSEANFEESDRMLSERYGEEKGAKLEKIRKLATHFFGTEVMQEFQKLGLDNHPGFLKGLASIADEYNEDSFADGEPTAPGQDDKPKNAWDGLYKDMPQAGQRAAPTVSEEDQAKYAALYGDSMNR